MSDEDEDDRREDYNLRPRKKSKKKPQHIIESSSSENEEEEPEGQVIDFVDLINGIINGGHSLEPEEAPMTDNEKYYNSLSEEEKRILRETEERINKINFSTIPLKYKVLESNLEDKSKALLMQKVTFFEKLQPHQGEYFKLKKYMDGILNIPFKKYKGLEISNVMKSDISFPSKIVKIREFISNLRSKLDSGTYGQIDAKNTIIEIVAKWITNPMAQGNIIGLCGVPGCGKTTLIKKGMSSALGLPFAFIPLGGSMTSTSLEGSNYTYEGARWGRIVDILMEHKCMNPILFFDELDKIPEDKFGDEITAFLIHLTDPSQNNSFHDKYFSGIDFDLSKCFIIFSFNDVNKINHVLRDRISVVNLKGFKLKEKITIARDYCLDNVCKNIGIDRGIIKIPNETLKRIITTFCPEKGVRKVEQCLNSLVMKINLFHITRDITNLNLKDLKYFKDLSIPYIIKPELAVKLLESVYGKEDNTDMSYKMIYN